MQLDLYYQPRVKMLDTKIIIMQSHYHHLLAARIHKWQRKGHIHGTYVDLTRCHINSNGALRFPYLCLKSLFLSVCQKQQAMREREERKEERREEMLVVSGRGLKKNRKEKTAVSPWKSFKKKKKTYTAKSSSYLQTFSERHESRPWTAAPAKTQPLSPNPASGPKSSWCRWTSPTQPSIPAPPSGRLCLFTVVLGGL